MRRVSGADDLRGASGRLDFSKRISAGHQPQSMREIRHAVHSSGVDGRVRRTRSMR